MDKIQAVERTKADKVAMLENAKESEKALKEFREAMAGLRYWQETRAINQLPFLASPAWPMLSFW